MTKNAAQRPPLRVRVHTKIWNGLLAGVLVCALLLGLVIPAQAATGQQYAVGLTTVSGQAWLPGPTGVVDGSLWVADHLRGLCRLDPDTGGTPHLVNAATCYTGADAPGQFAFDAVNNLLYVPAGATGSQSVVRLKYDPTTKLIHDPDVPDADSPLVIDMAPGQTVDLRSAAAVLGPDGSIYVSFIKSGAIKRINDPATSPTVEEIAISSDGGGITSLAFDGADLYLAEDAVVTKIPSANTCTSGTPCTATSVAGITAPAPLSLATDATHLYIGDAAGVYRYDLTNGTQELFGDTGIAVGATVQNLPLINVTSLFIDGTDLYVADDPTGGGNFQARNWKMVTTDPAAPVGGTATTPITVGTLAANNVTAPADLLWIDGDLGGHLWLSDHLSGFCRLDPAPTGNLLEINPTTCKVSPLLVGPAQVAYDPATNFVYLPMSREGIYRALFDPATETVGALQFVVADTDATRVSSAAVGPDGNLYLGYIRIPEIKRIVNPAGLPDGPAQTFFTIANTGGGVQSLAFLGDDLYMFEVFADPTTGLDTPRIAEILNAAACEATLGGACTTQASPGIELAQGDLIIPVAADGLFLYVGNAQELLRYDPTTDTTVPVARAGIDATGAVLPFSGITGIGFDGDGNIHVADDPSGGAAVGSGRVYKIERPIANAGPDQTVTVNAGVTLDASASSDPGNHQPLSFAWSQAGGPAVTLTGADTALPTFPAPATPALLTFDLKVTDGIGMVSVLDTVQVTVNDESVAGLSLDGDNSTTLGQLTHFTATTTAGTNIVYAWNFGDGSPVVSGVADAVNHTYPAVSTYTAIVTATNNMGSVSTTKQVQITNQPPVANAGVDATATVGSSVTLNGTASSDPDGHLPLSYRWAQTAGPAVTLTNATAVQPNFAAPGAPALLTFSLVVTDSRDLASVTADTVTITIRDTAIDNAVVTSSSPTVLGTATAFTATATGSNLTYLWNFGDGAGNIPGGPTITHTYADAGNFNAQVTIANAFASVNRSTPINVTNAAPVANAGPDQNVLVGTGVTLNGLGSSDPDGHTPLAFNWVQAGGSSVALTGANTAQPTFNAPALPGALVFALTVTDDRGKVSTTSDQVTIQVNDMAITGLSASYDGPVVAGQSVNLHAAKASGTNVTYAWSFGDGATGSGQNPTHAYTTAGVYTAIVTATNGVGSVTASASVGVGSLPPTANADLDQEVLVGAEVTLVGSGSSDPGNHVPLTYRWTQVGGPAVTLDGETLAEPGFTAPATPATLTFRLVVTNTVGLGSTPDEVTIDVKDIPVGGLSVSSNSPTVLGQATAFTAGAAGSNITYSWSFGDGSTGTGSAPNHTYPTAGPYTAIVTATNSAGSVSGSTAVFVTNQAPVANAGIDQNALVDTTVTLQGGGSSDPDGHTPLTYDWQQMTGPVVVLSSNSAAQPTFTAPGSPTALIFSLLVTDDRGLVSAADEVTVLVKDAPVTGVTAGNDGPTTLGQATTLNVAASGSNLTYVWNLGDGTLKNGSSVSHVYAGVGPFTAIVTATNSAGSVSAATVVTVVNDPPIANAGADQSVAVGAPVTLNGSASSDPDGHTPLSFAWTQTAGLPVTLSNADRASASFTAPPTPTTLQFSLVVKDGRGLTGVADTVQIVVTDVPAANVTASSNSPGGAWPCSHPRGVGQRIQRRLPVGTGRWQQCQRRDGESHIRHSRGLHGQGYGRQR